MHVDVLWANSAGWLVQPAESGCTCNKYQLYSDLFATSWVVNKKKTCQGKDTKC